MTPVPLDTDPLLSPAEAEINLAHLRHNVRLLQQAAGPAEVMGVVKADAYGHGAVPVARTLRQEGVRHFAVATVPEAIQLRRAGLTEPILVFGAPLPAYLPAYVRYGLDVTVPSRPVAEAVIRTARTVGPLRAHVKVDTGMGRLGVPPEEAPALVRLLEQAPGVTVAGLFTHFATIGDAFVATQAARFAGVAAALGASVPHLHAASSGTLLSSTAHYPLEGAALVRMGVALYGIYQPPPHTPAPPLRPVMTLRARITHLKTVPAGTPVSYDRTWHAPRRTRIATLGAGYADGYPRALSNRGQVGLQGQRYPVVGTVCMDMTMVDLGPEGPAVEVGTPVVLFGEGGPSAAEVAGWAGTITYELCCGIAPRVPRRYHDAPVP